MNDYWNDPPEEWEPPECCGEIMDVDGHGNCICEYCGNYIPWKPDPPYDTTEEKKLDWFDEV